MRLPFIFMPMVTFCAHGAAHPEPPPDVAMTLHCPLRFEDGITEDVELRVGSPHAVSGQLQASLQLRAPEHGIQLAGDAALTQVDADSRLEFLLQQGELFTDGVLVEDSKYVRIARGQQHATAHVIARSAGPCLSD